MSGGERRRIEAEETGGSDGFSRSSRGGNRRHRRPGARGGGRIAGAPGALGLDPCFAFAPLTDTSGELLRRLIDDNLVSCFLCCREAVAAMRRGKAGGRIVNVAARQALEPRTGANISASTAAKAGVAALSAALGEELAGEGILVNAVAPSIMDTPTNRRDMPKANFDAWPKVEEVAATILFLASPENKVSRGGVVPVFGASSQSAAT